MIKRMERHKSIISILISCAMVTTLSAPVMGGEICETENADRLVFDDNAHDTAEMYSDGSIEDANDEVAAQIDGDTADNYYFGTIYVTNDGLYDRVPGTYYGDGKDAQKIKAKGISYNTATHTLTLENFSLGTIVDDFMSPDKSGSLYFTKTENSFISDITIELKGRNYIGGYSNYSRAAYALETPGEAINTSDAIHGIAQSVTFTGDGELLVNGRIHIIKDLFNNTDFRTSLPVWSTYDFEGANIQSVSINDDGFYPNFLPNRYYCSYDHSERDNYGYTKIGGEKPNIPNKPEPYITVSRNLGTIGGHTVSVCFMDNIPYEGRKILKKEGYMLVFNNKTGEYEQYNPIDAKYGHWEWTSDEDSEWYAYRSCLSTMSPKGVGSKNNSASASYRMAMTVYVDGKPIWNPFVTVKYKNNVNVANGTVSPCFAFSIKEKDKLSALKPDTMDKNARESCPSYNTITKDKAKSDLTVLRSSGMDKNFIKAVNDYFKEPSNWITFTILPIDIKYTGFNSKKYADNSGDAATYRINQITRNQVYDGYASQLPDRMKDSPQILSDYKKKIKIKGGTIKRFPLYGQSLWKGNSKNLKAYAKPLKWDKKYKEGGTPDISKDFHVTVSGNVLVVTGQGNYINSIIVPNPYS